ncbi:hypothetical protein D3C81_1797960 [compost metagenome]
MLALIGQTNGILRQQRVQQPGKGQYLRLMKDIIVQQWVFRIRQMQLKQQIGQAGADRHFRTKQLHTVARLGLDG